MWWRRARWMVFAPSCIACGASAPRGDGTATELDPGTSPALDAAGSGGAPHSGAGGAAGDSTGQGGSSNSEADASAADAMTLDAASHDASADTRYAPDTRACPMVDECGSRQGAHCPAALPIGACATIDTCYYCDGMATWPSVQASCVSGEWSWSTAQPCAH